MAVVLCAYCALSRPSSPSLFSSMSTISNLSGDSPPEQPFLGLHALSRNNIKIADVHSPHVSSGVSFIVDWYNGIFHADQECGNGHCASQLSWAHVINCYCRRATPGPKHVSSTAMSAAPPTSCSSGLAPDGRTHLYCTPCPLQRHAINQARHLVRHVLLRHQVSCLRYPPPPCCHPNRFAE